jgi:hypothetical protein
MVVVFYQNLFTVQEDTLPEFVTQHVLRKVAEAMNTSLVAEFSHDEVRRAAFMMHPIKSLGPDGFIAGFFQRHWELVGYDISTTVLFYLNGGEMTKVVNSTILVLISKVRNPQEFTHFRPI